jgi:hypothetical protein
VPETVEASNGLVCTKQPAAGAEQGKFENESCRMMPAWHWRVLATVEGFRTSVYAAAVLVSAQHFHSWSMCHIHPPLGGDASACAVLGPSQPGCIDGAKQHVWHALAYLLTMPACCTVPAVPPTDRHTATDVMYSCKRPPGSTWIPDTLFPSNTFVVRTSATTQPISGACCCTGFSQSGYAVVIVSPPSRLLEPAAGVVNNPQA